MTATVAEGILPHRRGSHLWLTRAICPSGTETRKLLCFYLREKPLWPDPVPWVLCVLAPEGASDRRSGQGRAQVMAGLQELCCCAHVWEGPGRLSQEDRELVRAQDPGSRWRAHGVCVGPASGQRGCRGSLPRRRGLSLEARLYPGEGGVGDRHRSREQSAQAQLLEATRKP